jgi:hypothetical protein
VRHLPTNRVPHLLLPLLRIFVLSLCVSGHLPPAAAQETPLFSGGMGFFSTTNGGKTSYLPTISPVLEAPLGNSFLVESRANLLEDFFPGQSGYTTAHFAGLSYLQLDYLATSHVTMVTGYFLTPFGTYNERLSPIWIGNFQDGPLILPIGTGDNGSSSGFMMRGSAVSTANFSVDYAAYFSANCTNSQFESTRAGGGRVEIYFPRRGLEIGTSYARSLTEVQANSYGLHLWWQPIGTPFRFRSEYAHGAHAAGYWIETDYRLSAWGGPETALGRIEPVFRWQQAFRNSPDPTDGLPSVNTNQAEFGLDYRLPHELRILTSYGRRFTPGGDRNIWQTGLVYRFLFPAWKGRS